MLWGQGLQLTWDTVESVVGNALEDLNVDEPLNLAAPIDRDSETNSQLSAILYQLVCLAVVLQSTSLAALLVRGIHWGETVHPQHELHYNCSLGSCLQQFSHQDSLDSSSAVMNTSHVQLRLVVSHLQV
jgi:hypothetical protein